MVWPCFTEHNDAPGGGLWFKAEVGDDVLLENVEAICCALERYSTYYDT